MAEDIEYLNDDDDVEYTSLEGNSFTLDSNGVVSPISVVSSQNKIFVKYTDIANQFGLFGGSSMTGSGSFCIQMSSCLNATLELTNMRGTFYFLSGIVPFPIYTLTLKKGGS